MVPLQIPGLPELLVIVVMFALWLALPAFVALVVYRLSRPSASGLDPEAVHQFMDGRNAYEERIDELEDEVARLREELD